MRTKRLLHAIGLLLVLSIMAGTSRAAAQVRALTLREMVASAGTIFIGTVTQAQGGTDQEGDIVTYTTFSVEQALYGKPGSGITIKQLGGETGGRGFRLEHMRYFRAGERVLVMLYPVSGLGFTSPVGLHQAVWKVTSDGKIAGVTDDALQGLGTLLRRYGIAMRDTQSIDRSAFISIISELLKEGGKR